MFHPASDNFNLNSYGFENFNDDYSVNIDMITPVQTVAQFDFHSHQNPEKIGHCIFLIHAISG
jgi:hypothetical protein